MWVIRHDGQSKDEDSRLVGAPARRGQRGNFGQYAGERDLGHGDRHAIPHMRTTTTILKVAWPP